MPQIGTRIDQAVENKRLAIVR